MKHLAILLTLAFLPLSSQGRSSARKALSENPRLAASNMFCYQEPDSSVAYTAAPEGYLPVYLSMYARHGSRHLTIRSQYSDMQDILHKAYQNVCLTTLGKRTMVMVDSLENLAHGRTGELTDVGALQHQGIARRIYEHFPTLFTNNVLADARSTPIQRTILSMLNQCMTLKAYCPQLVIRSNASQTDVAYLDYQDHKAFTYRKSPQGQKAFKEYSARMVKPERFIKSFFSDEEFIKKNVNKKEFMLGMFTLANVVQNEGIDLDFYDIFTEEELFNLWKRENFKWYIDYTLNPLTDFKAAYTQIHLLHNFVTTADTCLASSRNHLTLRFGHEVDALPFMCLLRLSDTAYSGTDGDDIAENWRNYLLYPMACNIQFVFFRKTGSPDLVKILLNEREQKLPIPSDMAPYYKWADVRAYMLDIWEKGRKL